MDILIVNGSPRGTKSNTAHFTGILEDLLQNQLLAEGRLASEVQIQPLTIKNAGILPEEFGKPWDALVFCFPLYVDSIPSNITALLLQLEEFYKSAGTQIRTTVYAIINCGFFEGEQTNLGISMIRHWCKRSGLRWGGGLGIGGGEMFGQIASVPLGHGPKKSLGKGITSLALSILNADTFPGKEKVLFVKPDFPRFLFSFMGSMGWVQQAKKNGLSKKELFSRPT
jgi:hypothetical protein